MGSRKSGGQHQCCWCCCCWQCTIPSLRTGADFDSGGRRNDGRYCRLRFRFGHWRGQDQIRLLDTLLRLARLFLGKQGQRMVLVVVVVARFAVGWRDNRLCLVNNRGLGRGTTSTVCLCCWFASTFRRGLGLFFFFGGGGGRRRRIGLRGGSIRDRQRCLCPHGGVLLDAAFIPVWWLLR